MSPPTSLLSSRRGVVRLGDRTTHGGTVTSASSTSFVHGLPVAREGDRCDCPLPGHVDCVIVEGDPNVMSQGKAIAFEGCRVSCGAVLLSTLLHSGRCGVAGEH